MVSDELELVSWSWNLTDSVRFHMEKHWSLLVQTDHLTKVQQLPFKLMCQYNLYKCFFAKVNSV